MSWLPFTSVPGPVDMNSLRVLQQNEPIAAHVISGQHPSLPNTIGNVGAGYLYNSMDWSPEQLAQILVHESRHQTGLQGKADPYFPVGALEQIQKDYPGIPAENLRPELAAWEAERRAGVGGEMVQYLDALERDFGPIVQPIQSDEALAKIRALVNGLGN